MSGPATVAKLSTKDAEALWQKASTGDYVNVQQACRDMLLVCEALRISREETQMVVGAYKAICNDVDNITAKLCRKVGYALRGPRFADFMGTVERATLAIQNSVQAHIASAYEDVYYTEFGTNPLRPKATTPECEGSENMASLTDSVLTRDVVSKEQNDPQALDGGLTDVSTESDPKTEIV